MSYSSSGSAVTRENFDDILILAMKDIMMIPENIKPYNLTTALETATIAESELMLLSWLKKNKIGTRSKYSSGWKHRHSVFVTENLIDFCPLVVTGRQHGDLTLWDNRENICILLIEVISRNNPSATFLHLVISLIDMCRVYNVNSVTGFLFPSCSCRCAVIEVTVDFKDCVYQIQQCAYSEFQFKDRVKLIANRSFQRKFTIANPIHIIPNSHFDKVKLCESILRAIDMRPKFAELRNFIDGLLLSRSVSDHLSFLNTGNNIVLTLGEDYVIKVPTRYSHSEKVQTAMLKLMNQDNGDYNRFAVLPIWNGAVEIWSKDAVVIVTLRVFIFPRLTSTDLNFDNLVEFMKAVIKTVEFIHSRGVAHCDLRLPNIFFTQSNQIHYARLIDFDLSKPAKLEGFYREDWKRVARVFLDMIIEACKNELDSLKDEAVPPTKAQKLRVAVNELRGSRKRLRGDGGGGNIEACKNELDLLKDEAVPPTKAQ